MLFIFNWTNIYCVYFTTRIVKYVYMCDAVQARVGKINTERIRKSLKSLQAAGVPCSSRAHGLTRTRNRHGLCFRVDKTQR